jgi:hypothetical protein
VKFCGDALNESVPGVCGNYMNFPGLISRAGVERFFGFTAILLYDVASTRTVDNERLDASTIWRGLASLRALHTDHGVFVLPM